VHGVPSSEMNLAVRVWTRALDRVLDVGAVVLPACNKVSSRDAIWFDGSGSKLTQ
jgi:hypothetical protein